MLDKQLTDEIYKTLRDSGDLISKVHPPATEAQIEQLKSVYSFPAVFYDLMRFSNGMELFNFKDLDGYRFYSVDSLIKENKGLISTYEEQWTEAILVFCEILGEGNYIAVNLATGEILDGFHEVDPDQWRVISPNLISFLDKLIKLKGEKFWL